MNPVILFRKSLAEENEFEICSKYFDTYEYRSEIPTGSLVIPRYSALPYYKELEADLRHNGSAIINSYEQHHWIANFEYYETLKEFTPESWDDSSFYRAPEGAYVVKGKTNSRKQNWNKQMFAASKREALDIAADLASDSLIGSQGLIYRKYIPLETFDIGFNGLPFANEWRFFFYGKECLSYGYYWTISEIIPASIDVAAIKFAHETADIVAQHVNFFVLDIAKTAVGSWVLIEINDGSMSGLSENNPDRMYFNLKARLK